MNRDGLIMCCFLIVYTVIQDILEQKWYKKVCVLMDYWLIVLAIIFLCFSL